jgi:signal peptidase II
MASKSKKVEKELFFPFILSALIVILDQITKTIIVRNWPLGNNRGRFIMDVFDNDLLILYHVRNTAIAFSIGDGLPQPWRFILFAIVPIFLLVFLVWYYFNTQEFNMFQRWAIAGILGGGIGNIFDRLFRPEGVVDFISVKFYGIFGMERWPTFNVADSSVVVCCLLLLVTMLKPQPQQEQNNAPGKAAQAAAQGKNKAQKDEGGKKSAPK